MNGDPVEAIRRRYDEFDPRGGAKYKAFLYRAHEDVGFLLDEIDRLRREIAALCNSMNG